MPGYLSEMLVLLMKIDLESSSSSSCHLGNGQLALSPNSNIGERWSTVADVRFIGRQSITDRLTASTDGWRIGAVVLLR